MATSRAQRTGIWVITIAMIVGTVVGFVVMILSSQQQQKSQAALADYESKSSQYQKDTDAQQTALDKDKATLSKKYYGTLAAEKASRVKSYDAKSVSKTTATTLKAGSGQVIGDDTTYAAYYVGWTSDGKVFDSSIDGTSLKSAFIVRPGGVITGWSKMMKGKKIGGVYELSITAADGYGASGSGSIKANSPLKFIVIPIEALKTYTQPAITQEVIDAYAASQQ